MIEQLAKALVGTPSPGSGSHLSGIHAPGHPQHRDRAELASAGDQASQSLGTDIGGKNPNLLPELITEGETLNGGRQNRLVNVSVLVPAVAEIDIPVTCAVAGRRGGEPEFSRRGPVTPRRVRRPATASVTDNRRYAESRHSNQGAVWDAVDFKFRSTVSNRRRGLASNSENGSARTRSWPTPLLN